MMEHPCPLYTTTHSLLTEALNSYFLLQCRLVPKSAVYMLVFVALPVAHVDGPEPTQAERRVEAEYHRTKAPRQRGRDRFTL